MCYSRLRFHCDGTSVRFSDTIATQETVNQFRFAKRGAIFPTGVDVEVKSKTRGNKMAMKTYQETRVRVAVTKADGKVEKTVLEEQDAVKWLEELKADASVTNAEVQAAQT